MALQVGAKEQDVEDTKKDLAKIGWHRGAEVIICLLLLLWLWGTPWSLEVKSSQARRSWAGKSGVEWRSEANRRAVEGLNRKGVRGSLHVHYRRKRGVGVLGVGLVLEVGTQDLVRDHLV